jgi:hypothetical protein
MNSNIEKPFDELSLEEQTGLMVKQVMDYEWCY